MTAEDGSELRDMAIGDVSFTAVCSAARDDCANIGKKAFTPDDRLLAMSFGDAMSASEYTAKPHQGRSEEVISQRFWSWAPLWVLLIGSTFVAAFVTLEPSDPERVAAIFPPWWSFEQSLTAASGVAAVSGFGAFPFIVAVRGAQPDLAHELRKAGALVVVDGALFPFCESLKYEPRRP